jgi:hypothetical protein
MNVIFQNKRKLDLLTAKETSQIWQQSLEFWKILFETWDQPLWVMHLIQPIWFSCQCSHLGHASLTY